MWILSFLWTKLTPTQALNETSGPYETAFFEPVYRTLYLTGLSSYDKGLYLAYSFTVKFLIVTFVASELWYLFSMSANLDEVIANINVTLIHLIAMYRYRTMINNGDIFKNLAMSMKSPHFDISTPKRRAILNFWLSNNERYFKLLLTLGTCTLAAWYVYPLVDDLDYNLVVTVRLPFNYATASYYPITYALVLIAFHYASYFVMVNDVIMQSHLMHLLCQFMVLGDCFESIVDDCARDFQDLDRNNLHRNETFVVKYNERLGDLVEQHKLILRNTLELRRILSLPMLYQMAASSMLICFAGYQVTVTATSTDITKFLMSLLYLGYNMFELFIFCRWCDEIKHQSEKIREAVYFSGWERVSLIPGVRARLMMIIARASRPMVLTAGGVYDLSLRSYGTIVKTSYSALSVLLRTQHD
ncbi:hypothetical protein O0L34_g4372 [Tuta absoluta]|nr:hypothetical protein O0L34_g4372 [Tuta absoluta]